MAAFPEYTPAERRLDAAVHAAGVTLTVAAIAYLLTRVAAVGEVRAIAGAAVYCTGLASSFAASAAYNLARGGEWKEAVRRADRVAIYLLIAGTYTPFALVAIGGRIGAALLAAVWLVAAAGIALALLRPRRHERKSLALYIALGWIGLPALGLLVSVLPGTTLALLGAGGLLYTGGVAFHVWDRLPANNAIWHAIVLAAAACHYLAVLRTLAG